MNPCKCCFQYSISELNPHTIPVHPQRVWQVSEACSWCDLWRTSRVVPWCRRSGSSSRSLGWGAPPSWARPARASVRPAQPRGPPARRPPCGCGCWRASRRPQRTRRSVQRTVSCRASWLVTGYSAHCRDTPLSRRDTLTENRELSFSEAFLQCLHKFCCFLADVSKLEDSLLFW